MKLAHQSQVRSGKLQTKQPFTIDKKDQAGWKALLTDIVKINA